MIIEILLAIFLLFLKNGPTSLNSCHFLMNGATETSLVACCRSFNAVLQAYKIIKIISSKSAVIYIVKRTKTFVLGRIVADHIICFVE